MSTHALEKRFEKPDCIFCKGIVACMRVLLRDACANRAEARRRGVRVLEKTRCCYHGDVSVDVHVELTR